MKKKYKIGTNAFTYPEIRNFAGMDFADFEFSKTYDLNKLFSYFLFKFQNKINNKYLNSFNDLGLNQVDFFHFFNVIHTGKSPFITTFETKLPRWNDDKKQDNKGLDVLFSSNCKRLIALSQCAFNLQIEHIKSLNQSHLQSISEKMEVMLPPQKLLVNHYDEKQLDFNAIEFTIVGADFFRKGGMAVLKVFDKLLLHKYPVKLNIVSSLNYGDYASKTTKEDYQFALKIIEKHEKIQWLKSLSNVQVMNVLKKSHVAILPSIAETFGYFILEAQANGCPVITTDIRAMPEINNNELGWLINTRMKDSYDADLTRLDELEENTMVQLEQIMQSICANPAQLEHKSMQCIERIKTQHNINNHQAKLEQLYYSIVNGSK